MTRSRRRHWDPAAIDQLRNLTAGEIERALAALPVEFRFVVMLDLEGFSEAETADILRCPPGTVKSRLSRGKGAAARVPQGDTMSPTSPTNDEADRLIAAALRDHARVAAPARLRTRLEQRYLGKPRRWVLPTITAFAGAALAALVLILVRPAPVTVDVATEAVGDHLRVISSRGLGVETNNMHNVKPWFTGKLDFVPPVSFLGDDEFVLRGGDVAVFLGHKAAAFSYGRRLHVISLFVFESASTPDEEHTIQGFHVKTWGTAGFGFALVSDVNWDELRTLRGLL